MSEVPTLTSILTRQPTLGLPMASSLNIFRDQFRALNDKEWFDLLVRSMDIPTIEDVPFPAYPHPDLQSRVHGNTGVDSLAEAQGLYFFVRSKPYLRQKFRSGTSFLDFGAGWGRITRMFLREFDLKNMFGYEPNLGYCALARILNPYVCFFNGDYAPDGTLPADRFDLVVGWSVFTHLPENLVVLWLEEMVRVLRPDGYGVFTTWGERFLNRLIAEEAAIAEGKEVHWYSHQCLAAAGDIKERLDQYFRGEYVWFTGHQSEVYGETFMHPRALRRLLERRGLALDLVEFDQTTLGQDVFILRRRSSPMEYL